MSMLWGSVQIIWKTASPIVYDKVICRLTGPARVQIMVRCLKISMHFILSV